jgi:uncharacterized membrane protein YdjX (TVP38/TMEM64 family)
VRARGILEAGAAALAGIGLLVAANLFLGKSAPALLLSARDWIDAAAAGALPLVLLAFLLAYALLSLLFLPAALWLSVACGFALGPLSFPWMALSVALGDALAFRAARRLFRERFERRFGGRLKGMRSEIEARGWRYLLALRLMPGVPYPLITAASALSPVGARTQFLTTLAGFAPACALYCWAGSRMRDLGDAGALARPEFLAALAALALAVAIPAVLGAARARRGGGKPRR